MTRDELQRRVLTALNDDPTDPVFFTVQGVLDLLEEAAEALAEETTSLTTSALVPRRPGAFLYDLRPLVDRLMTPYRIWLPDRRERLEAVSLTELDGRHEQWMRVNGEPEYWAPVSWDTFVIWPFPATGEGWLQLDCFVWPETLLDGDDVPAWPESDHEALALYAEHEMYVQQWDVTRATDLWQSWLARAAAARTRGAGAVQSRLWQREEFR
jgi:hypothetical protein